MIPSLSRSLLFVAPKPHILEPLLIPQIPILHIPNMTAEPRPCKIRRSIPAVLMRAGTSKGLFIHRQHLPPSEAEWAGPLLAAMGSKNSDARQIDGVGGATSTTSKVAVVSPSSRPGVDVDYTFVQVAVGRESVEFYGNCGNMASGVGPFAIEEGLVQPRPGEKTAHVRIFNTNTSRTLIETVEVDVDGSFREDGNYKIPGVSGTGSEVKVAFIDPAGSMTGALFPTGKRVDTISVDQQDGPQFSIKATLIDAANPFVVVDASTLPRSLRSCTDKTSASYLEHMEAIRLNGSVMMGLAPNVEVAKRSRGTPKLAIVSPPPQDGTSAHRDDGVSRISISAFSMGQPHPSLQLTGAVCLAAATCIDGTVAHQAAAGTQTNRQFLLTPERTPSPFTDDDTDLNASYSLASVLPDTKTVRITHSSGEVEVDAVVASTSEFAVVERCTISRTARRLFKGEVYYYC